MKKYLIFVSSTTAVIYTIWYMHFGSLTDNSGALSKTGLIHPILFTIWGILTFFALSLNIDTLCKRHFKSKIYIIPLIISAIGMALTLLFDFDYDKRVQYYLHCTGSLIYSIVMSVTIFLIFALNFKKGLIYIISTVVIGILLISDLICLIKFQETALIEAVPVIVGLIITSISTVKTKEAKAIAT